jgi:aminoglycoside 6'-N-acetyltransferase
VASTYDTGSTYDTVQFSGGFDLRTKFDVADLPAPVRQAFGWSTGRSSSPVRSAARPTLTPAMTAGTDAERVTVEAGGRAGRAPRREADPPATEPRLSYRPATDDDVDLLAAWHADPEVARYWDDERPSAVEIRCRLRRPTVDHWIVLDGDEPVGFLQSWRAEDEPLRGGLDGFLIPSARGRGLMPRAARELAGSLLDAGWAEVTVDPYEWNERAIRGWRNAGFVEVSRGHRPDDDHAETWVLMRFARSVRLD